MGNIESIVIGDENADLRLIMQKSVEEGIYVRVDSRSKDFWRDKAEKIERLGDINLDRTVFNIIHYLNMFLQKKFSLSVECRGFNRYGQKGFIGQENIRDAVNLYVRNALRKPHSLGCG